MVQDNPNRNPDVIDAEVIEEISLGGQNADVLSPQDVEELFVANPPQPRQMVARDPGEITLEKQRTWGRQNPPRPPQQPPDNGDNPQQGGRDGDELSDEDIDELFNIGNRPAQGGGRQAQDPGEVTLQKQRTWGL